MWMHARVCVTVHAEYGELLVLSSRLQTFTLCSARYYLLEICNIFVLVHAVNTTVLQPPDQVSILAVYQELGVMNNICHITK